MGIGPMAEQMAGHQLYSGQLYYLAIRPDLAPGSAAATASSSSSSAAAVPVRAGR
jgi:hypothetical protein